MGTTLPVFPGLLGRCISVTYPGFQDKLARSSWPETHRPDHVSNEEVYDRTGTAPLSQSVKARQTRFLGLCLRRSQGDLLVNQDMVDIKFYSTSMLESWSGQDPPFLSKFVLWQLTAKLGSAWRSTVGITGKPHERLSQAERGQAE